MTILSRALKVTLILIAIGITNNALFFGKIAFPVALEHRSGVKQHLTAPGLLPLLENAFKDISAGELENTFSVFLSVLPVASILFTREEICIDALAVLAVVLPVSLVLVAIKVIVTPEAAFLILRKISFVAVAVVENIDPFTVEVVVLEIAKVSVTVGVFDQAFAMFLDTILGFYGLALVGGIIDGFKSGYAWF